MFWFYIYYGIIFVDTVTMSDFVSTFLHFQISGARKQMRALFLKLRMSLQFLLGLMSVYNRKIFSCAQQHCRQIKPVSFPFLFTLLLWNESIKHNAMFSRKKRKNQEASNNFWFLGFGQVSYWFWFGFGFCFWFRHIHPGLQHQKTVPIPLDCLCRQLTE